MKSEKLQKTICRISGEEVSLKPFSIKYLNDFYKLYLSSKREWEKFVTMHFKTIRDASAYLKQQTESDIFTGYFIVEKENRRLVGFILGDELDENSISVTLAIGKKFESRGYGREALFLFEQQMKNAGYKTISAFCDYENQRSANLFRRAGYEWQNIQTLSLGACAIRMFFLAKQL